MPLNTGSDWKETPSLQCPAWETASQAAGFPFLKPRRDIPLVTGVGTRQGSSGLMSPLSLRLLVKACGSLSTDRLASASLPQSQRGPASEVGQAAGTWLCSLSADLLALPALPSSARQHHLCVRGGPGPLRRGTTCRARAGTHRQRASTPGTDPSSKEQLGSGLPFRFPSGLRAQTAWPRSHAVSPSAGPGLQRPHREIRSPQGAFVGQFYSITPF